MRTVTLEHGIFRFENEGVPEVQPSAIDQPAPEKVRILTWEELIYQGIR